MIEVFKHSQLLKAIEIANEKKSKLHLIGLVSRGGVHSSFGSFVGIVQAFERKKQLSQFLFMVLQMVEIVAQILDYLPFRNYLSK